MHAVVASVERKPVVVESEGEVVREGAIAARAALALTNSPDAPTNSRAGSAYFPSLILTLSPIFLPPFSFCLRSLGYNADIKPE